MVTILLTRRSPGHRQVIGLLVGLLGVGALSVPNLSGAGAEPFGMLLLIVAVAGYGVSNNVVVPLQQAYGSPAIVGRALAMGAVMLAPLGLLGLFRSDPTVASIAAVAVLGVAGTGLARALNATLAGRTGAARGALPTYLAPVVAIALGALFRGDHVERTELAGTALVLSGALLTSRRQRPIQTTERIPVVRGSLPGVRGVSRVSGRTGDSAFGAKGHSAWNDDR